MPIRRLRPADALAFRRFRLDALKESPTAFGSSHSEEAKRPVSAFRQRLERRPDNWVFGSLEGKNLIGVIRLAREENKTERHKASIYGLYVAPSERRRGIARKLLERAIATAMKLKGVRRIRIAVVTSNTAAIALYKEAGFGEYGREEESLLISGKFYSEFLLDKKLRNGGRRRPA